MSEEGKDTKSGVAAVALAPAESPSPALAVPGLLVARRPPSGESIKWCGSSCSAVGEDKVERSSSSKSP